MPASFFLNLLQNGRAVWRWVLFISVAMLVISGWRLRMDNSPEIWLPRGDPEVELYERFKGHYGNDSFVALVTSKFESKDTARAVELMEQLRLLPGIARVEGPVDDKQCLELDSHLLGARGTRMALLVTLPVGLSPSEVSEAISDIEETAARFPEFGDSLLVGTEIVTRDLNRGSEKSFGGLFPLVALALSLLVWAAFRSLRIVFAIFACVAVSAISALGCMAIGGATLNLLVVLIPAILVVLAVAASVHICSRYLDLASGRSQHSEEERLTLWSEVLAELARPCALATFTTALGFASLGFSQVGPVSDLGIYTAIGSVWVLLYVFTLVPLIVSRAPVVHGNENISEGAVRRFTRIVRRSRPAIVICGTAFFLVLGAGVPRLHLESNVMTFFDAEHPLPRDYRSFEEDFFGLTSFEILMEGPLGRVCSEETIELLDHIQKFALEESLASHSFSPWLSEEKSAQERAMILRGVLQDIPQEVEAYTWRGGSTAEIRMTLTAPTGSSNRAYEAVTDLRAELYSHQHPPGMNIVVGGAAPLLVRGQVLLLDTQVRSFATALLSISLVIVLAYRSARLTLLSLICNVFPVAGTLGLMGWLDIPLNAGTVTVAGIALGLIVDDTIHIIHGFAKSAGEDAESAVVRTLSSAGKPILVTSVAVAVGFGLFGLADFQPTKYFGLLTAATSILALAADLVLLPAFLLGDRKSSL